VIRPRVNIPTLRNFADVDRALAEWRSRLEVVDDNLRELDDEPTLRKLEGRPGVPAVVLEGATAARVGPALRSLRDVWAYRDRLADAIDRAQELRKSVVLKPWAEGKQMQAIDDLLNGPSITLQSAKTTPLALRSLMTSAQERNMVTPASLLRAMESSFADARDAVFAVDAAWDKLLPSLVKIGRELEALRTRAATLGLDVDADADQLACTLDGLRRQAECDPLGALESSAADLEPRLALLRARIDALEHNRASVQADLANAETMLERLESTNAAAADVQRRCQAEIRDPRGLRPALDAGHIEGLRPWLATLRATADKGNWSAARVGLDRWLASAADYLATAEAARAANSAPLEQRDQLAGLLSARRAQSEDLARRAMYLDPEVEEAARQAKALLAEVPCRLAEAEAQVTRFDAAVSKLAQSARRTAR
jgi:chromosome segregation ATPase